jgi:integrase
MELLVSIKTPRLIRDRCGVYYFRLVVPLALRNTVGKTEFRRSLRTKDATFARVRALELCLALEGMDLNPKITDFPHLLAANPNIRKKINLDLERGIIQTDTPEEAERAERMVANYAEARKAEALARVPTVLPASKCGTNLKKAQAKYELEKKTTIEAETLLKHTGVLNAFIEFVGNLDVGMVTSINTTDFKQKLLAKGLTANTINDQIGILRGFFDYCIRNKVARMENPATGLYIPKARGKVDHYKPFTVAELKKIFKPDLYINKTKLPDLYWGPLIALFTGARAEEIASLDLSQIYPVKGIYVIDILVGKTANATRRVPIHDQLLELGLLDYVKAVKSAKYTKLFPHLQDGKNGYKKNMCRQFGEYLDSPEVDIVHPLKVFHSFRHTVVTLLTSEGVNEGLKRAMVGHDIDTKSSAHDVYIHSSQLTVPNLKIAISKLHYKGINFGKLKVRQEDFLPIIAKRIIEQKERKKRAEEKKKAEAKGK